MYVEHLSMLLPFVFLSRNVPGYVYISIGLKLAFVAFNFSRNDLGNICEHGIYLTFLSLMMRENSISSGQEALVGIIMGSDSDLPVMKAAAELLETFNVAYEVSEFL